MATETYRRTRFKPETHEMIQQMESIIEEYDGQSLTARQLFYQLVSRDLIPNTDKSYKRVTGVLADARYAGYIDWDAIEDRGRTPKKAGEWESIDDLMEVAMSQFRLPRWDGQSYYIEVWVEKQALEGVLEPITRKWHANLMVNKGYSSASSMKEAADRMIKACQLQGDLDDYIKRAQDAEEDGDDVESIRDEYVAKLKKARVPVVLYLGDHDPSGEDMVRDIRDRLREFRVMNVRVEKLALTMAQIKQFNPPPNPAKITDSRARGYIEKFGTSSWELDALPPKELNRIVELGIAKYIDKDKYMAVIGLEDLQREKLRAAMKKAGRKTK